MAKTNFKEIEKGIFIDLEKAKITHYKKDKFVSVRNGKAFINFRPHSK